MSRHAIQSTYAAADKVTNDDTQQTTVCNLAIKTHAAFKAGSDEDVLPSDLSKHRFEACSLHGVDFSDADLTDTVFGKDTYLYNINFYNQDLTKVTFDPKCKVRAYGQDRTTIQPFNLTNAKVTHEQLLLFIKRGVVDITQINWEIQSEVVQQNKVNYQALCHVMNACRDLALNKQDTPFTIDSFSTSYRRSPANKENKLQQLVSLCDPSISSSSEGYTHIDINSPFFTAQKYAFADVIYTLEQERARLDTEHDKIKNNGYHHRILDGQFTAVRTYTDCDFNRSSLRNVTYQYEKTRYKRCHFADSNLAPKSIKDRTSSGFSSFLRFQQCEFTGSSTIESNEEVASKLQFIDSSFTNTTLNGNFNCSSFSNPYQNEVSPAAQACTFTSSTLNGSFRGVSFVSARITSSKLNGDFTHANFNQAHLTGCDLSTMTYSKGAFARTTLKRCTVNSHERIMHLMLVGGADIMQLDWKKMGRDPAPYTELHRLFLLSNATKVKQTPMFIHLMCDESRHVRSLTDIQSALNAEGKSHHTRFVPDIFLRHAERNSYYRKLKELDLPSKSLASPPRT
ncbi:MAG: pentapeptide repeat-containing protein [Coxiellaceae bacterium]|nr:pentapeptide repeat-containing protein [Coxiellaceae bacterium]